jgi:stage II sporulation protein D (peptidoglycan lytic transglycosylase)
MRPIFLIPLTAFLLSLSTTGTLCAFEKLRLLVGDELSGAEISGKDLTLIDGLGREFRPGNRIKIKPIGSGFYSVDGYGTALPGSLGIISENDVLQWNEAYYRGSFQVSNAGGARFYLVNLVDLESYLLGLVNSEVPSSWPLEALKAQAVAARTYALWKKANSENPYHLLTTTLDQVYHGAHVENIRSVKAVRDTAGWFMSYRGKPILAYYHSCCGGHTDSGLEIKGRDLPYLAGVPDTWCSDSPKFSWALSISSSGLAEALIKAGHRVASVDSIIVLKKTSSGRVLELKIVTPQSALILSGEDLRKVVGYQSLRSTRFEVTKRSNTFHFKGTGYGHGVGACQYGMRGLAEQGYNWRQILGHFYKGVTFTRLSRSKRR